MFDEGLVKLFQVAAGLEEEQGHKTQEKFLGMGVPGLAKEDCFTEVG